MATIFGNILKKVGGFLAGPIGGPLLSTGLQLGANAIAARRERKFAREAWNEQNRYNSPVQQLSRYREAGMNPAYGAGMASGNAAPMSNAATNVAHVEVPNVLENLMQYQSLKNANLEGQRLEETVKQARTQTSFLAQSLMDRVMNVKNLQWLNFAKGNKAQIESSWMDDLSFSKRNPMLAKYNLDVQRYDQAKQMFDIDIALEKLGLSREQSGLTGSDSAFLRILQRMHPEWEAGSFMPYAIGEGLVQYGGDVLKNMVPRFGFGKLDIDGYRRSRYSNRGSYNSLPRQSY